MRRCFRRSCRCALACLLLLPALLLAQPIATEATVGVPYSFDFGQGLRDIPNIPEISFTYSFTATGGSLPPGITLKSDGLLSGVPTTPGQYTFTITYAITLSASGQSLCPSISGVARRMRATRAA